MSETPRFLNSIQDVVDKLGKLEGRCVSQREAEAIMDLVGGFAGLPEPGPLLPFAYTKIKEYLRVILEENKIDVASMDPDVAMPQGGQVVPELAAIAWWLLDIMMWDENDPQVLRWAGPLFGFLVATLVFRAIDNTHELLRRASINRCIRGNIARGEQTRASVLKKYNDLKKENPDLEEMQAYAQAGEAAGVSSDHAGRIIRGHLH